MSEEIGVELGYYAKNEISSDVVFSKSEGFLIEFVWKSTSFDRMLVALRTFSNKKDCMSSYLSHKILGHVVDEVKFDCKLPKRYFLFHCYNLINFHCYHLIRFCFYNLIYFHCYYLIRFLYYFNPYNWFSFLF